MCKKSMQFFATAAAVFIGCKAPANTKFLEPFIATAGQYSLMSACIPQDSCVACEGRGTVLMDGKTPTKCQACDGTGKTKAASAVAPNCKDGSCQIPRSTVR